MNPEYKPKSYNSVSPYLIVDGADEAINFLKETFDAVELRRFPSSEGKVFHAEVKIDDTVVMLADSSNMFGAKPTHVHVYVSDVDSTYKRAIEAGAVSLQEPVKKDDADKRGGVKDAHGNTWWIGTKVE